MAEAETISSTAEHDSRGDVEDGYNAARESGNDPALTSEDEKLLGQDGGGTDIEAESEAEIEELWDRFDVDEDDNLDYCQEWKAPDGGWGWVVVVSALAIAMITDGIIYTFGIFLGELEREFQAPKSKISLTSSVQVAASLILGPVASALTNRFGCRKVIMAGTVISTSAYLLCFFSRNVTVLILTYGLMGGIGLCMMYLPSFVSVSLYFDKKRALATCTASCGTGIGTFIMAPVAEWLVHEFNWRWALVIQAGILLNGLVFGALIRPLDLRDCRIEEGGREELLEMDRVEQEHGETRRKPSLSESRQSWTESGHWLVMGRGAAARARRLSESASLLSGRVRGYTVREPIPQITLTDHDKMTTVVLLAAQTLGETTVTTQEDGKFKSRPATTVAAQSFSKCSSTPTNIGIVDSPKQIAKAMVNRNKHLGKSRQGQEASSRARSYTVGSYPRLHKRFPRDDARPTSPAYSRQDYSWAPSGLSIISLYSENRMHKPHSHHTSPTGVSTPAESVSQYEWTSAFLEKDSQQGLSAHSIRTYYSESCWLEDSGRPNTCGRLWACMGDSVSENMEEMLNLSILKDKVYWFVLIGNFIVMLGFFIPFTYIKALAIDRGIEETDAAILLSVIGLANTLGRALTGIFMQLRKINSVLVTSVALIIASVPVALFPVLQSYALLVLVSIVFGLSVATFLSLCSVLLCDLLGVHNLTNAFGYVILLRGVACLIGPPMAGAVIDETGKFDSAFFLGAAMLLLGGVIHLLLYLRYLSPCMRSREAPGRAAEGGAEEALTKMLENLEEGEGETVEQGEGKD